MPQIVAGVAYGMCACISERGAREMREGKDEARVFVHLDVCVICACARVCIIHLYLRTACVCGSGYVRGYV
jgi:hypothetical protein